MKIFLELTRARNKEKFLANLDHIQEIHPAALGSNICWSNGQDSCTQVEEEYSELRSRISFLLSGGLEK
jgi:hypothetical protein